MILVVVVFTFPGYFSMSLFAKSEPVRSLMLHPFCHRAMQSKRLSIKPGIQKRGTECGECGERGEFVLGFREISERIPGNVIISTFQGMFQKFLENVRRDSGKCSRAFRGMFEEIPGNVQEDSGECCRSFRGMLKKIPGMLNKISRNVCKDSRKY